MPGNPNEPHGGNSNALETLRRWYRTHDTSLLADDIEFDVPPGFPGGRTYHGRDDVVSGIFTLLGRLFDGWTTDVDDIREAGDLLIMIGRYSGTARATSEHFVVPVVHLWRCNNGALTWFRQYTDTFTIQRALGGPRPA